MQGKKAPMIVTLVVTLFLVIPLLALVQQPGNIDLPEGEGAELVRTSCVGCHSMERTLNRGRSAEGWEETVNGMVSRGAQILSADAEIITNYLAEHFGVDFVPPREQRLLVWVDRQGREEPLPLPPQHYYLPRLSPDAQQIAVEVHRVKPDIWIYDIPTGEMRQLTHEGTNRFPLWSPDGQRVLFSSDRHQETSDEQRVFFNDHDVYWKSADGSGQAERLTYGSLNHGPQRWTPDGKTLSFYEIHPETGRDIWMLPFEGDRKPWLFLNTPVLEGGIAFSADGNWMAHTSEEPGQREIVVRAFPQGHPMHQVSRGGGIEVVWPPKSKELFYRFGNKRMAVEITTEPTLKVGTPRVLFEGDYVNSPGSRASWDATPDGQRFLLLKKVEGPALSGVVSSPAEGEMEGVLVTAKGVGGSVAVTVVTDKDGRYTFPRSRLQPGPYRIGIRAVGYDLEDPGTIEVQFGSSETVNLRLHDTRDLASQLSNVEWLLSVPGTDQQRNALGGCVGCHSIAFAVKSTHDAAEWKSTLHRMRNYSSPSFWLNPIKWPWEVPPRAGDAQLAEYLSSVNLSSGPDRKYELKTLPRPKGVSTRVIITEYDLPRRESQPHDASVAPDGMVWYSDFGLPYLGRLNPRTGEIREWRIPVARAGSAEGSLDVKFDAEGNPWVGLLLQRSVAKFDRETETFQTWAIPEEKASERSRAGMVAMGPEGKVWLKTSVDNYGAHLLDPSSGEITTYPLPVSYYGTDSNSKGDLYLASLSDGVLGEVIAQTGKVTVFPTPTPRSGSRRGHIDDQDRFWFAEFFANQIGMFDTTTKEFREWPIPTPWAGPYDAVRDRNDYVWSGGMHTDLIYRLNPTTGEVTEYLMPTLSPNFRNIDVDSSTEPVSVWLGANHQAKIIRVEPLD